MKYSMLLRGTVLLGTVASTLGHSILGRNTVSLTGRSNEGDCQSACQTLASEFGDRLHYHSNDSQFQIWDQKQQEVVYACRVQPSSAEEVSKILDILVKNWCRFAVKCGGHSRFPDDSNSVGGVTIDLGLLNSVDLAADNQTARIGGGTTSNQAFRALNPLNLSYVGGRVGTVGLGGFTLGGGTSIVSAEYGWAVDNVFEYEVVLPNSTIVYVSENQYPDLYFALRGGGNNFGIVTSFTVRVFEQGFVFTGSRTYGDNVTHQVLDAAEKIYDAEDSDVSVGLEITYTYTPSQDRYTMTTAQRYSQAVLDPPIFDELNSIPSLSNSSSLSTPAESTSGGGTLGVNRNVFDTLTHFPSLELSKRALEIYKEEVQAVKNVTGINARFITYTIPAGAIQAMKHRGGNALGIDVEGHLMIILITTAWTHKEDDETVIAFARNFIGRYKEAAAELDALHPYIYINYANQGEDVFAGYGEQNKQRLIEIQKSIDPSGVFTSEGLWRGFHKVR